MKEAKLPEGLIFIGNMAFNKATSLTEVVIPNSVTTLDEKAFQNCSALADVTIGTGVTEIGKSAFYAMLNQLNNVHPSSLLLHPELVERASCAKVNAK